MGRSTSICESPSPRQLWLPLALTVLFWGPQACRGDAPSTPPATEQAVIRAQGLLRLGDPAAALAATEAIAEQHPSHVWCHRVAQDALIALDRSDEVRLGYLDLQRQNPDSAAHAYLAGRAVLPDADAARPLFETAVQLDPDFAWGHVGLAQLEVLRGDLFRAIVIHRDELGRGNDPDLQMSLGFLCLDLRLLRDAQKAFNAALAERPWDPRLLGGLGQTLGQLGNHEEAITQLERALAVDPSRTDLMGALAFVHYQRGDLHDAWEVSVLQAEVDGSVDPFLVWNLERRTGQSMPQFATLGPRYLAVAGNEAADGG